MRLTSFTDYCIRVLTFVAVKDGSLATIDEIARHHKINRNHLMKVVFRLSQLGYLKTIQGKGGGIRMGMDPAQIRLGKLVRSTEDDLALVECFQSEACHCVIEPGCVAKKALRTALDAFFASLDEYTLADLVKPRRSLARLLELPAQ
jgi:Rrf2 family nitric oxide-sensitive transcriptional repressor